MTVSNHSKYRHLTGRVFGHPSRWLFDGEPITTSYLESVDIVKRVARTHNRVYQLGEPDQFWLKAIGGEKKMMEEYHRP